MQPSITVIIATTCESTRAEQLRRAIASVKNQKGVHTELLIVVNGDRVDKILYESLKKEENLSLVYLPEGSFPKAIAHGVKLVDTAYFCFLDDDDVLLPDSISMRAAILNENQTIDVVVSNGFKDIDGVRTRAIKHVSLINDDPMLALTMGNWLASCGGMYRRQTVDNVFFVNLAKYREWSHLAYRISLTKKIYFIDKSGYVINDTPDSLSKTSDYAMTDGDFIKSLFSLNLKPHVRKALKRKMVHLYHGLSFYSLKHGNRRNAWKYHLLSLKSPHGWQYLTYTRKILLPWFYKS